MKRTLISIHLRNVHQLMLSDTKGLQPPILLHVIHRVILIETSITIPLLCIVSIKSGRLQSLEAGLQIILLRWQNLIYA